MRKSALIIHIGAIHLAAAIGFAQGAPLAEPAGALHNPVNSREQRCCHEAEKTSLAALAEAERFGPLDLRLAQNLNAVARVYFDQGRYLEAGPLFERALSIQEKALGHQHALVALTLNSLAELRSAQGSYSEAESLFRRALSIKKKTSGLEHRETALIMNNL